MGDISLSRAALISIIVEGLLYGIYAVLFGYTQLLIFYKTDRNFNKPLWMASILMFIVATSHLSIDATRIMSAFVGPQSDSVTSDAFLEALNEPSFIAKSILYQIQTYIGDACIIYRTYILYGRRLWVVGLPGLILVACVVFGSGLDHAFILANPASTPFMFAVWAVPYVVGTLITNVICTSMIVARIVRMSRASIQLRDLPRLTPLLVIIESGAIYSTTLLIMAALGASSSNGYTIVIDLLCPVIGVTFSMIIIRVHTEDHRPPPVFAKVDPNFSPLGISPSPDGDILTQPQFTVSYASYSERPTDAEKYGMNTNGGGYSGAVSGPSGSNALTVGGEKPKLSTLNTSMSTIDLRFGASPLHPAGMVTRGADGWFRSAGGESAV